MGEFYITAPVFSMHITAWIKIDPYNKVYTETYEDPKPKTSCTLYRIRISKAVAKRLSSLWLQHIPHKQFTRKHCMGSRCADLCWSEQNTLGR